MTRSSYIQVSFPVDSVCSSVMDQERKVTCVSLRKGCGFWFEPVPQQLQVSGSMTLQELEKFRSLDGEWKTSSKSLGMRQLKYSFSKCRGNIDACSTADILDCPTALCGYPIVNMEIRDSSQISTTAPIFLLSN